MTEKNNLPFRFRFRVRYAECDAQSVMFNARYADYVDIAVNEYGDFQPTCVCHSNASGLTIVNRS